MKKTGYILFHLNLAFSSIEIERRKEVIDKCYWPILNLAETYRINIEITGFSLEEIYRIDKSWVKKFKELINNSKIELIGSGYVQLISPLFPSDIFDKNISEGEKFISVYSNVNQTLTF
jgi:hypothetical protein